MANYISVVLSNSFLIDKNKIDDARRAFSYFEESYVDDNGVAFIGSYDQTFSDDLKVLIDKRTNRVIGSYDAGYQDKTDIIEENGDMVEDFLSLMNIKSEDEYDENDFEEVDFFEYIQSIMTNDLTLNGTLNYCLIKEVGHEKLRYSVGCGILITKDFIEWIDIDQVATNIMKEKYEV